MSDAAQSHSLPAKRPMKAAALGMSAAFFAAGTTLLAKALGTGSLGGNIHALQISQGRFMFALITISMVVLIRRPKLSKPNWKLHVARSSLSWSGVTLMFAAAAFIPLSDATAISFLNPMFAVLFAIPLLGESVGKWRWISSIVALIGVVILMRPATGVLEFGAVLALMGAVLLGLEINFLKRLTGGERPIQILWINNGLGLIIATFAASFVWVWPTPAQWAALAGVGVLMASAQACFTTALRVADASFVSPFLYLALAFAAFFDAVVFGVLPDGVSIAGATLILLAAGVLAWRETRQPKQK